MLNEYSFSKVSGTMLGMVIWGREETVEVNEIGIQHLDYEPHALVTYSGQRTEGDRERTFHRNFKIPFSPERGLNSYFFSQPIYRGVLFFGLAIHHIDHYTITIATKDSIPEQIQIKVEREYFRWGLSDGNRHENVITDIIGEQASLL